MAVTVWPVVSVTVEPARPLKVGPTLAEPLSEWQAAQPSALYSCLPFAASAPAGAAGVVELSDLQQATEELLERALAEAGDDVGDVETERLVVQGGAAEVLVDTAGPDDLLVVGSRGHGGFAGLLLGSVSQQCVHHAACAVVVVHPPKPTAAGDELGAAAQAESPTMA